MKSELGKDIGKGSILGGHFDPQTRFFGRRPAVCR